MYSENILNKSRELMVFQENIYKKPSAFYIRTGIYWYSKYGKKTLAETLELADTRDLVNYFNWFVSSALDIQNRSKYGVFAAEGALPIWKEVCARNNWVQSLFEATKQSVENPTNENTRISHERFIVAMDTAKASLNAAEEAYSAISNAVFAQEFDAAIATAEAAAEATAWAAEAIDRATYGKENMEENYIKTMKYIVAYGLKLLKEQGIE